MPNAIVRASATALPKSDHADKSANVPTLLGRPAKQQRASTNTFRHLTECIVETSQWRLLPNAFDDMLTRPEIGRLADVELSDGVMRKLLAQLSIESAIKARRV